MADLNLDAIEARRDDAYDEVVRLCDGKRWLMSVPADASRDSDLLITASLDDVPTLVARVRELEATVQRVRDLHAKDPDVHVDTIHRGLTPVYGDGCSECGYMGGPWPCPTICALDGEGAGNRGRSGGATDRKGSI